MKLTFHKPAKNIRRPAVAGRFYPSDPEQLRDLLQALLAGASAWNGPGPKALLVPHAGYRFSGPIAASAYGALQPDRDQVKRVVLLGPAHFVAFEGVAVPSAEAFATPLGTVPVDLGAVNELLEKGMVVREELAHAPEHCLEVQLPFLQIVLERFTIVPLLVGDTTPEQIARMLDLVWGGSETRIVISSDLSHYLSSPAARMLDAATAAAIEALDPERIGEDQACGRLAIRGLLAAGALHGLRPRTLDLRNSGDTGGPPDQVVGYGAFVFED